MPRKREPEETPHEKAVSAIEQLLRKNIGGELNATADCNQCPEKLTINLTEGATTIERNKTVGSIRPDLTLLNLEGDPVRFIEVVDSHAPEGNVHDYAVNHGIEIVEFHLKARGEFTGKRRNRALDESLRVKARLGALADGRLEVDAHNLLCLRPKCKNCGTPLALRTITISKKDCWNCGQNVNVAVGDKDGMSLEQDDFTQEERAFAKDNGVTLDRRFSATVQARYLANICTECDQIQGNWFLYMDPYHDRFNLHLAERKVYGPCDRCAERYCLTHGEYLNYDGDRQCPTCLMESERVMCHNRPDRECFYPHRCEEGGCYFVNREERQREEQRQYEEEGRRKLEMERQKEEKERPVDREAKEQRSSEWTEFQEWFAQRRQESLAHREPDEDKP